MSKGNTFENDWLKLIFNAVPITNLADDAASSPLDHLHVSLHVGDPGEGGDQSTSEISYTPYARQGVARTTGGWTVTGNSVSSVASVDFPTFASGAGGTATHFAIGTASAGSGKILYSGPLNVSIAVGAGVQPKLGTITVTED